MSPKRAYCAIHGIPYCLEKRKRQKTIVLPVIDLIKILIYTELWPLKRKGCTLLRIIMKYFSSYYWFVRTVYNERMQDYNRLTMSHYNRIPCNVFFFVKGLKNMSSKQNWVTKTVYSVPLNVKPQGGGRPGIGGVFDVRRLPVAGAFDHRVLWVGTFDFNR